MPNPAIGIAGVQAGASIIGGAGQARAARRAASAQVQAAAENARLQREAFATQQGIQDPFIRDGRTSQNRFMDLMGLSENQGAEGFGRFSRDFGMDDFEADPGYAFRLSEGNKQLERSAASRGMVLSGQMFKGLQRFGQDMGAQEYQNAFDRYQTNRNAQLDPLYRTMGAGQGAANILTGAAGDMGRSLGENALGAGNARASGYVGSANAYAGMLNNLSNTAGSFFGGQAGKPPFGGK